MLKTIVIRVDKKGIFLNPILQIKDTNFPIKYLSFKQTIYMLVEMVGFEDIDKTLKVKVIDFNYSDISSFENQAPKKEILNLSFEKCDWLMIEPYISGYTRFYIKDFFVNTETKFFNLHDVDENFQSIDFDEIEIEINEAENEIPEIPDILKPLLNPLKVPEIVAKTEKHFETLTVEFSELRFKLGYVSFEKHIEKLNQTSVFNIANDTILPEFENIKYWFAKKIGVKKITVSIDVTHKAEEIIEKNAKSRQIDAINSELIDGIKYQRTMGLLKEPMRFSPDKSLFTSDDIFSQMNSDDLEGNVFNQTDVDLLAILLEKSDLRNKKELSYLAGKKQSEKFKLKYTLTPNFGFLFFMEGEKNNHFAWELLNSNSTYIWSIEKSAEALDLQYKRIENELNMVRTFGRIRYKSDYKTNNHDKDLVFNQIIHENIGSDMIDSFPKWKSKLNELIV